MKISLSPKTGITVEKKKPEYPPEPPYKALNLRQLVKQSAELFKNKDYLKYKRGGEIKSITFNRFDRSVDALGSCFDEMGLRDSVIGVIGETTPEWIMTYLAAVNLGSVIVPLDRELSREELKNFIIKADIRCLVYAENMQEEIDEIKPMLPDVRYFIHSPVAKSVEIDVDLEDLGDSPVSAGESSFDRLMKRGFMLTFEHSEHYDYFLNHPIDMDKCAAILFTSGTTGTSKGVMLSVRNLVTAINDSNRITQFSEKDVLVSVLPIHHTYEMTCGILTPMVIGCTVCINDGLKNALKSFQFYRPTILVLVPVFLSTMYKKILDTVAKKGAEKKLSLGLKASGMMRHVGIDLRRTLFKEILQALGGNLRIIVCGGAAMNPELMNQFDDFGISVMQGYGITECAPLISCCPTNWRKYNSVGLPVKGLEVKIEPDDGSLSSDGYEIGEILVRGANVMLGYYKDPTTTAEAIDSDGWFRTGDYGYQDSDGFLFITGRKKNVIVLNNGKNVFPEEIESYIENISLIKECVVVGRGDSQTITVTAVIYPDFEEAEKQQLTELSDIADAIKKKIAEINKTLPTFKQIRGIEMRKVEFEKTTTKKIKRKNV